MVQIFSFPSNRIKRLRPRPNALQQLFDQISQPASELIDTPVQSCWIEMFTVAVHELSPPGMTGKTFQQSFAMAHFLGLPLEPTAVKLAVAPVKLTAWMQGEDLPVPFVYGSYAREAVQQVRQAARPRHPGQHYLEHAFGRLPG